jgi:thiol-disulfide isomerase/thioredoxin
MLFACLASLKASAQHYRKIEVNDLQTLLHPPKDSIYILNFWATWCAPCVAELPLFVSAEKQYRDSNFRFFYVSLDFKKDYDAKVIPFISKHLPDSYVLLLGNTDYNSWINLVNPHWQGAIPATFVVSSDPSKCKFYEGEFTEKQLSDFLNLLK